MFRALRGLGIRSRVLVGNKLEKNLVGPQHAGASVLHTLDLFKRSPVELALVTDEYGSICPDPGEEQLRVEADGSLSIDGATSSYDLQERLDLREMTQGEFDTAAGLVLALFGRMPTVSERAEWDGWSFEVLEMDGLRVARLRARRLPRSPGST